MGLASKAKKPLNIFNVKAIHNMLVNLASEENEGENWEKNSSGINNSFIILDFSKQTLSPDID